MLLQDSLIPFDFIMFLLIQNIYIYSNSSIINDIEIDDLCSVTVVGDLHGQLEDLYTIFKAKGVPSPVNKFLFNGDLIDRGKKSLELLCVTLFYKLLYPDSIYHNKGNHECRYYFDYKGDFEEEVKQKYPDKYQILLKYFNILFDELPLCSIINKSIFIVHGGITDHTRIDNIRKLKKKDYDNDLYISLLWNDPGEDFVGLRYNDQRHIGHIFGSDITSEFCNSNHINYIIRSHQYCHDGVSV